MKNKILFTLASVLLMVVVVGGVNAQKKVSKGKVCGDPTLPCKSAEDFQVFDLPFDMGKGFAIFESEKFYGIVLKSVKLSDWGDCNVPSFDEAERLRIQEMFPHNKVFALNCVETGQNFYTGVADKTAFVGVFAGRTLAAANRFLKTVRATGTFPNVKVRQMSIGINGT